MLELNLFSYKFAGASLLALSVATGALARPTNDDFVNAVTISGTSALVSGNNLTATTEAGEPASLPDFFLGSSVWWRWTAPTTGTTIISTEQIDFDTTLAVFTGNGLNSLTLAGHNDDNLTPSSPLSSLVSISTIAGVTYHIAVGGWGNEQGNFALRIDANAQASACHAASPLDRVFYAPFDAMIGPDLISNTPNTGTPVGPDRFLTATTIPGHTGQVLHLNHVDREDRTNFSGRVRFLRDGMSGRSPFAFMGDDFSINFWMRTTNDHARLLGTRQRNGRIQCSTCSSGASLRPGGGKLRPRGAKMSSRFGPA